MATKRTPTIGDIVLLHTTEGGDIPVLVTAVDGDKVTGQAFLSGTERAHVENIGSGKDDGQFSFKD